MQCDAFGEYFDLEQSSSGIETYGYLKSHKSSSERKPIFSFVPPTVRLLHSLVYFHDLTACSFSRGCSSTSNCSSTGIQRTTPSSPAQSLARTPRRLWKKSGSSRRGKSLLTLRYVYASVISLIIKLNLCLSSGTPHSGDVLHSL